MMNGNEASLSCPAAHLLLCSQVPNRPWTSISQQQGGRGVLGTPACPRELFYHRLNLHVSPNIICWKTYAQRAGFGGGAFRKRLVHEHRTIMNECNAYINSYRVPCSYHTLAMVVIFLVFWGTFILFSILTPSIYIPTNRYIQMLHFKNLLHSL